MLFTGLSGWFSCSVHPSLMKSWVQQGGTLAGESEAMYLFSDDAFTKDTTRLYGWQKDIVVIQTSWIKEILQKQCPVRDIPLSHHILTPHFMVGLALDTTKVSAENEGSSDAESAYTQYNAVWDKLENDCSNQLKMEAVIHVDDLAPTTTEAPFDFILSHPEFKVYKK